MAAPQPRIDDTTHINVADCAEYISFYAIGTNYNGPIAAPQPRIDDTTHINVVKYGASYELMTGHHQVAYKAVASRLHV
eukprot:scaffold10489_cov91-Skeletonema_menzelii.AAC.1